MSLPPIGNPPEAMVDGSQLSSYISFVTVDVDEEYVHVQKPEKIKTVGDIRVSPEEYSSVGGSVETPRGEELPEISEAVAQPKPLKGNEPVEEEGEFF
jgi:hypothetical protein